MPAQWTGVLIGRLHNVGITAKQLAAHMGLNDKYVSQVLNGHCEPKNAETKFNAALDELIEQLHSTTTQDR